MCLSNRILVVLFVLALLLSACQPIQPPTPAPTDTPLPPTPTTAPTATPLPPTPAPQSAAPQSAAPPPGKVLFVGNSFLYWGLLDQQLEKMAAFSEPPLTVDTRTSIMDGGTLKMHWDRGQAAEAIRNGGFDAVILQGDIPEIVEHDVEQFYEHVRLFDQEIKNAGAQTVLYMTWGYPRLDWIDTDGIIAAHGVAAEETGAKAAPLGLAWKRAMEERPDLNLYGYDNEHPSVLGTFLMLNVLYATLFDRSPVGHPYRLADFFPDPEAQENPVNKQTAQDLRDQYAMSEEDAEFLQRIAWETIQEWQSIP